MEAIDFRVPLQLIVLVIVQEPEQDNKKVTKILNGRVSIRWEDIHVIEEFIHTWLIPNDTRDKVNIVTAKGNYIVIESYEHANELWSLYKLWIEDRKLFNFN